MSDQMNWMILGSGKATEPVRPQAKHTYDLLNISVKEALTYGERKYGINLVWGDAASSDSLRFHSKGSADQPLKYGGLVAINVRGGGFLRYQQREYGINLVWSHAPVFEWKFMGGAAGAAIRSGAVVALFNTTVGDYLFYDPRTYGINLKWLKDKGKMNEGTWFERHLDDIGTGVGGVVGFVTGGPGGAIAGAKAGREVGTQAGKAL
jgi:hypothetical protein